MTADERKDVHRGGAMTAGERSIALAPARLSAKIVLALGVIATVLVGVRIW